LLCYCPFDFDFMLYLENQIKLILRRSVIKTPVYTDFEFLVPFTKKKS